MHDVPEHEYIDDDRDRPDTSGHFHIDCAFCRGTGVHLATMKSLTHAVCPACQGKGILEFAGSRKDYSACRWCEGAGREPDPKTIAPCRACHGYGIL